MESGSASDVQELPNYEAAEEIHLSSYAEGGVVDTDRGILPGSPGGQIEVDDEQDGPCNAAEMQENCPVQERSSMASAGPKRRGRCRTGSDVRVGPPRELGAVESALRNSSGRYGSNHTNGDRYQTSQELVCQLEATRDTVRYLRENNVSLEKVHCILGSYHGSADKLPFTKSSLRTVCQQVASDQKDDDIKKTMDLFRSMHAADPDFAFRFELDDDGRIRNLIWTTGRSRRQYTCFGDVVVFDTTYTTNLYKMPFGLFVGVNNHYQTVIYAGILMCEETIEAFSWAYREFVSLMGGTAHVTMLTDQCRAMEVAIGMTLPDTTHRWCKWHVFRKAKEELGGIFSKKTGFKDAFNNVVNEMLTVDEFEKAWKQLVEEFNLVENSFMIRAFEARHKWAKPFFKDKYCARMTSIQRVESANHMLKTYVPRHSPMNKFVSQYSKLQKDRNEAEDAE